ncbi:MAG TPA: ATP synthase subunit I [Pirellulales bacterium]|jgi:F1F0 ATPase subunit 2|nr:ATP synthase subunit I [Pirellulales bacterium]
MNGELAPLLLAAAAGLGLGLFYFGGLWLTVRWLPKVRSPAALIVASLIARTGVTLLGFYLVMAGHWERMAACLIGFVVIRYASVAWFRPESAPPSPPFQGDP